MFDLRKLFVREARAAKDQDPDSEYHPSGRRGEGLEVEYQTLIATQFRRWGIATGCVTIEVRLFGRAPDGFDVFVGMVRLDKWDRISALRVLLGLPLLEAKVRKTVRSTWMADFSHFGGLWLHASESLHNTAAVPELRDLMMKLVPHTPHAPRPGGVESEYATSSLPPGPPTSGAAPLSQGPTGSSLPGMVQATPSSLPGQGASVSPGDEPVAS